MKKLLFFVGVLFTFILMSCGKPLDDVNDYFPELRVISVTPEADGSLTITAEIVKPGAGDVEYVGMCFSENGTPGADEDQQLSVVSNNKFSVNYSYYTDQSGSSWDLDNEARYYVRAFATNAYGYAWSEVFEINPWTVPSVEAPCTPTLNSFSYGSGTTTSFANGPSTVNSTYDYTMNGASADVKFMFGGPLETGVFTTAGSSSFLGSHEVSIQVTAFNVYTVASGALVYVNEISTNYFEVTVCSAPIAIGASQSAFTARFRANG
jgi:hypothetical protein